jgi:hypothetical protein
MNNKYKQNINHLYNRLYLNNFLQQLRQNPLKPANKRLYKNTDYYDQNNDELNENAENKFHHHKKNNPEYDRKQTRMYNQHIDSLDSYDYETNTKTTKKTTTTTTTVPTLNVNVHLKDKKNGQKFNGMNVNVNLLNNKNKISNSTYPEFESVYSDEEIIKSLSNIMNQKNIKLSDNQEILIPRNSRPDPIMDSIPLSSLNENLDSFLTPLASSYIYENGNSYSSPFSSNDRNNDRNNKANDDTYKTTTLSNENMLTFNKLNYNNRVKALTNTLDTDRIRDNPKTISAIPVLPDGLLTIISNNNNNVNINEDKLTIEELFDLARRNNNRLTKIDLLNYDQNKNRWISPNQPLLLDNSLRLLSMN